MARHRCLENPPDAQGIDSDICAQTNLMIAPLAQLIEWAFVQATFTRMPHPDGNLGLDEAIQFLHGPDFMPAESQPAQLVFDNASDFHFPTPRPGAFAENNFAF